MTMKLSVFIPLGYSKPFIRLMFELPVLILVGKDTFMLQRKFTFPTSLVNVSSWRALQKATCNASEVTSMTVRLM